VSHTIHRGAVGSESLVIYKHDPPFQFDTIWCMEGGPGLPADQILVSIGANDIGNNLPASDWIEFTLQLASDLTEEFGSDWVAGQTVTLPSGHDLRIGVQTAEWGGNAQFRFDLNGISDGGATFGEVELALRRVRDRAQQRLVDMYPESG